MMDTMIKSNTIGKLRKIYEGKSFSDPLVIITELFQNSYRAEAKNVEIILEKDIITFKDDGCGCDNPENILTLDMSSWKSTDEGFGIGLWSWLAVPNVERLIILSDKWKLEIDVDRIFKENNPVATIEKHEKTHGFTVMIESKFFKDYRDDVIKRIKIDGQLQPYNVYLNGEMIEKIDLQKNVTGDFVKSFNNKLFEATLSVNDDIDVATLYYEKRKVTNYYNVPFITGVIEMKKGALTLQEPDRKNIIYNEKKQIFTQKLSEVRKELYKEFVKNTTADMINKYADAISDVLDVEDYERYIFIDDEEEILVDEVRSLNFTSDIEAKYKAIEMLRNKIETENNNKQLSMIDKEMGEKEIEKIVVLLNYTNNNESVKWVATDEIDLNGSNIALDDLSIDMLEELDEVTIGNRIYRKINIEEEKERFEQEDQEIVDSIYVTNKKKKRNSKKLKDVIKKSRRKVWVRAEEIEEYETLIAKAEYYGIKVLVAKNILYENIFKKHRVPHIIEIKEGVRKRNFIHDVCIKTKKEQYYLELLQPILKYYNLPEDTFLIGRLKLYIETVLDGVIVHREIIENTKESIKIKGLKEGCKIILDRKALGLQRFNLQGRGIGTNELKAVMATMDTIAHELAHLLYNTEDNTKEHFEKEKNIKEDIINIYLTF